MTNYLYISLQHFWDLDSPECWSHCNCSSVGDPPYRCTLFYSEVWGSFHGWKVQPLPLSKDTYIPYTIYSGQICYWTCLVIKSAQWNMLNLNPEGPFAILACSLHERNVAPAFGRPSPRQITEAAWLSTPPAHTAPHSPSKQSSTSPSHILEPFTSRISVSLQS